jgi:hypothetical protein
MTHEKNIFMEALKYVKSMTAMPDPAWLIVWGSLGNRSCSCRRHNE